MFREIWSRYQKMAINASMGSIITTIAIVLFITFMIVMVEYAVPSGDIKLIVKLGVIYVVVNLFRAVVNFWEDFAETDLQKNVEADYREKIFVKLQNMQQSEIDHLNAGNVLENMLNDTKEMGKYWDWGIDRSYTRGLLRLIGTLAVLLYLNVPIILVAMVIYGIGFVVAFVFQKKSLQFTEQKRKINSEILGFSNEQINGFETVKALEVQAQRMAELKKLLKNYEKAVEKLEKNIRMYTCFYDYIVSFVLVVTIVLSGVSVLQGIASYGTLIVLARYISSPETYAKWVIEGFQYRNVSRISYQKVLAVLEKAEEEIEAGKTLSKVENIVFRDIHFSYDKNQKVLSGRTGSGKTSLVNLLCRFYELEQGEILINGQNYQDFSIQSLRDKIGYILQKVVIFEGTILENINIAKKNIAREKIIEICQKLNLHEKIRQFENGYDTVIDSETDLFSNGEKQMINFARVMVQNPDILILDEATASLSDKSEMLVQNAIREITKGKISLIIAHRLSTIKDCDKIIYLQDGKIIEQGNHENLLEQQGEYYKLINA